jgi:hypothetical protein
MVLGLGQFGRRVTAHLRTRLEAVDARRALFYSGDRPDLFDEATPYHGMRRFLDACLELHGQVPLVKDLTALVALQLDEKTGALELAVPRWGEADNGASFDTEALLPALAEPSAEALSRAALFARVQQAHAPICERLLEHLSPLFNQRNFPGGDVTCAIYVVGALTELSVSALAWPVTAALRYHLLQKLGPSFEPRLRVVGAFSLATFERPEPLAEAAALAALQEFEHFSRPASRTEPETVTWLGGSESLFMQACGRRLWRPCYLLDRAKLEPPLQVKDEYELICSTGNFLEASLLTSLAAVVDNRCHNYLADIERLAPYSALGAVTHVLPIHELASRGESFRTKAILRTQVLLSEAPAQESALRMAAQQAAQKAQSEEFSVEALIRELTSRSGRLLTVESAAAKAEGRRPHVAQPAPRLVPRLDHPRPELGFRARFFLPMPPHDWYSHGLLWYRQELHGWFGPRTEATRPNGPTGRGETEPTREQRLRAALGLLPEAELLQRWSEMCAAPSAISVSLVEAWMQRVMELTLQRLGGEAGLLQSMFFLEALAAGLDRERFRLLDRGEAPHKRNFELQKQQWLTEFKKLAEMRPDARRLLLRMLLISGVAGLPAADYWLVNGVHGDAMTANVWWGLGLLGWAAGLSGAAALATLGAHAWRTRRLQAEFLQIYRDDLMMTIEDRVYQALKQAYDLAHALVTHLFKYMRQNYDALSEYARSSYVSRLPKDSFTFRSRFHPELNRRILTPPEVPVPGQAGQVGQPAASDLRLVLQYQIALALAGNRTASGAAPTPEAARRAREVLMRALPGQVWPDPLVGGPALAQLTRALVKSPANVGWRALPGSAQLTLEDFLADSNFAEGAPLSMADQADQFWKQALPNLDVNRNLMRDELKDPHPDWELRQQNFAEVMPLEHAAMVVGLPQEAHPALTKSAGQAGATLLGSLDPFALTVVRTLHGLTLSTESFPRIRYLTQVWAYLNPADRARLTLPLPAGYRGEA